MAPGPHKQFYIVITCFSASPANVVLLPRKMGEWYFGDKP